METSTPSDSELAQALGRLRVALETAYERASRNLGLTAQQAELVCAAIQPRSVGDLAQELHCDRSNVSHLVDRGAARGLLRRSRDTDGRVSLIELTDDGERLATRVFAALEAQTKPLQARWSAERQREAVKLLNEVSATLESTPQT